MSQMNPRWQKKWKYDRTHNITRYIDPTPTLTHVHALLTAGASKASIAAQAGLTKSVITNLLAGQHNIRRTTAAAIAAVTMDAILARANPAGFVPAIGTRRRIRALMAIGYRHTDLGAAGAPRTACTLHQSGEWVARDTHDQIAAVFDRLCMNPGPSAWAVSRAKRNGHPPPLAWDNIDDPREVPNLGAVSARPWQRLHLEDIEWLAGQGLTIEAIAARTGVTRAAIEHACARHDRRDLLAALVTNRTGEKVA